MSGYIVHRCTVDEDDYCDECGATWTAKGEQA